MSRILIVMLCFIFSASLVYAEEIIVFSGMPIMKISEGGIERTPERVKEKDGLRYKCTISKTGDNYYWTTRENVLLQPVGSGAYTTFLAINGSGYVRIIPRDMKEIASFAGETEKEFDYVEHLLIGLKSITYYGIAISNNVE